MRSASPRRAAALVAVLLLAGCGSASHPRATSPGSSPLVSIGAGLRGQRGLRATVYARGVAHAAGFAIDSRGRLWVAAAGLADHRGDGVYLISGRGARPVRVIDGLDDPLGLVWDAGRLYVSSVGRVTVYSGLHGTRFRHAHAILHGPVAGGENNALVLLPDGRFAMGVTASCDHCRPRSPYSGAIVTFRLDGSDLRIYAARIRAAVGLALFPGTADLFATLDQRDDLGARTPGDALAVVAPGTNWRNPECYGQGGAPCRAVPPELAVLDKHAAVGPVVIVTGRLGNQTGPSALVSEWQSARVKRVALTAHGSRYAGTVSTWLTGVQHPLALISAGGGSVLVGDWGTGIVYRIATTE